MSKKSSARSAGKRSQTTGRPAGPDQPSIKPAQPQVVASARQQRANAAIARRRRKQIVRWASAVSALILLVLGAVLYQQSNTADAPPGSDELPAPRGGPDMAVDVNTLVGQPAQPFTLTDSEGESYSVTPGNGRPIALITHMGVT